ncbi:MAG: hypothetical protein PHW03_04010 [Eubacteriales bacterium]|nr:hypothetical protein [Eubacteriales bacterium]
MNGSFRSFLIFLIAFALTSGIILVDKSCSRIAGTKSQLYPYVTKTETGDIRVRVFGYSDTIVIND